MEFKDKDVLEFFVKERIIATMRNGKYGLKLGEEIYIEDSEGRKIGKAKVEAVLLNKRAFRKVLRKYSGFSTVEEWEQKARELHNGKLPKHIVILTLRELYNYDSKDDIEEIEDYCFDLQDILNVESKIKELEEV